MDLNIKVNSLLKQYDKKWYLLCSTEFRIVSAVFIIHLLQLDVFANIFINQLTEARHRGAFEIAYTGFTKLCHCLWTSSCSALHQKPSCWVQELLESLQSTSLSRLLTITRRSAGLPFYLLVCDSCLLLKC